MKNVKMRAICSILITVILYIIGYSLIGVSDVCIALAYVGAIVGGGCFWIGSKQ